METVETVAAEIVPAEIVEIVKREHIEGDSKTALVTQFAPYHAQIMAALEASKGVTDGSNPTQCKMARACRLELRRVRCEVDNTRKQAKADALRYGRAVDGLANVLKFLCEPEEKRLEEIERHSERVEAARVARMIEERTAALVAADADPVAYNLAAMDDATFDAALGVAQRIKTERLEAARKAEADRIAREKTEAEERERIRAENAKLKAEAEARERAAAIERQKAEAERRKIEAEREAERKAAERAQAEAKAKAEAEARRIEAERAKERAEAAAKLKAEAEARYKAEQEAERVKAAAEAKAKAEKAAALKAAKAPDRDKLLAFAAAIVAVQPPSMGTDAGKAALAEIVAKQRAFGAWIAGKVNEL